MPSYCALRDQASAVWYLTISANADHTLPVLDLTNVQPVGANVTPTQPHWLEIEGPGSTWYVLPDTDGDILVQSSAPGVGTGLPRPQGLALMDQWRTLWRITVSESGGSGGWISRGWMPPGWLPYKNTAMVGALIPVLLAQTTFEVHLPQGVSMPVGFGAR